VVCFVYSVLCWCDVPITHNINIIIRSRLSLCSFCCLATLVFHSSGVWRRLHLHLSDMHSHIAHFQLQFNYSILFYSILFYSILRSHLIFLGALNNARLHGGARSSCLEQNHTANSKCVLIWNHLWRFWQKKVGKCFWSDHANYIWG